MPAQRGAGDGGRPVCLVLMPMVAGFEEIRASVAHVVERAGFEMRRLEAEIEDAAWLLWLLDAVDSSHIVLADLTDHNPFVMYELGCAHQRRLPTCLIMHQRDQRLPATVRGEICTPYGESRHEFERDLQFQLQRQWIGQPAADLTPAAAARWYRVACRAADRYALATGVRAARVQEAAFVDRLTVALRRGGREPASLAASTRHRLLLSLLLAQSDQVPMMRSLAGWCPAAGLPLPG